jgi:hypothetical protein
MNERKSYSLSRITAIIGLDKHTAGWIFCAIIPAPVITSLRRWQAGCADCHQKIRSPGISLI